MEAQPGTIATWLGAGPQVTQALAHDWASWDSWADIRAFTIVSLLCDVSILLVDCRENVTELYTPAQRPCDIAETWVIHFSQDHFSNILVEDIPRLHAILEHFTLAPIHQRDEQHKNLTGGALPLSAEWPTAPSAAEKQVIPNLSLSRYDLSPLGEGGAIRCHSLNVGGLRSHVHDVVDQCQATLSIMAIQETNVTRQVQRSLTSALRHHHLGVIWGRASPYVRTASHTWRADRKIPGVAFVHSESLQVFPVSFRTSQAQNWQEQGRLLMLALPLAKGPTRYLVNLYAPSGAQAKQARAQFYHDLAEELNAWPNAPIALLGDFQETVTQTLFYLQLAAVGWRLPLPFDSQGNPAPYTYKLGQTESSIDHVLVSPNFDEQLQTINVKPLTGVAHALLTCHIQLQPQPAYPRIAYPPKLQFSAAQVNMDDLWHETAVRIEECVHEHKTRQERDQLSWEAAQSIIDCVWSLFEETLRLHLSLNGTIASHATGSPASLSSLGDVSKHWVQAPQGAYRDTADRIAHKAVAWLVSLARKEGVARTTSQLLKHRRVVCETLNLTGRQFQAAMSAPEAHVSLWKSRLAEHKDRAAHRALRRWRAKLFSSKAAPTPTLFRWLRQVPHPVHLIIADHHDQIMGPDAFFQHARCYWTSIWQSDEDGYGSTIHQLPTLLSSDLLVHDVNVLKSVAQAARPDSAPGLDNWPSCLLAHLPMGALRTLLLIYAEIERTGCWPVKWTMVRTHLVPKTDTPGSPISDYRPLAVMSIWYRLWSAYRMASLPQGLVASLHPHLRGGLPSRDYGDMLATPLLAVEASLNGVVIDGNSLQANFLNLDAAKCFDYISMAGALQASAQCGLPLRLLGALASYWSGLTRHLSAGGHVDRVGIRPWNGIPQGCPLSALICNCIMHTWLEAVSHPQCISFSFLDDRQMLSTDPDILRECWEKSERWTHTQKWRLNVDKSHHMQAPRDQNRVLSQNSPLPKPWATQILGVDVPLATNVALRRQTQRIAKAKESAQRIAILKLPTTTCQALIEAIVLPQVIHYMQPRPLAIRSLKEVQGAIRSATFGKLRGHSSELILVLLRKPHRAHVFSAAAYKHILSLSKALRIQGHAWQFWQHLVHNPLRKLPRGPWATMLSYLAKLQLHMCEDAQVIVHEHHGRCAWLEEPIPQLAHFLRQVIRYSLLTNAAARRSVLVGVANADLSLTTSLYRKEDTQNRDVLAAILCDGLWPRVRMRQAHFIEDSTCRACTLEPESLTHVWTRCPRWQHLRNLQPQIQDEWLTLPLYSQHCLICPAQASAALKRAWPSIQEQCVRIWRARNDLGQSQGWVGARAPQRKVSSSVCTSSEPPPPVGEAVPPANGARDSRPINAAPYSFAVTFKLQSKTTPWTFSRPQWHALCRFAAALRIPDPADQRNLVVPNVLQFYLSYVLFMSGRRFQSDTPDLKGGGRIANQLNCFLQGWRSFIFLTGTEDWLPMRSRGRMEGSSRAKSQGTLPVFPLLRKSILLPKWNHLPGFLAAADRFIEGFSGNRTHDTEIWRRWEPGVCDSQMHVCTGVMATPLTAINPSGASVVLRRLRQKSKPPQWQLQQLAFRSWAQKWPSHVELDRPHSCLLGLSVRQWVLKEGVLDRHDVLALVSRWARIARLAQSLITHNTVRGMVAHVFDSALQARWTCARCGTSSTHTLRKPWLNAQCLVHIPWDVELSNGRLANQASDARTIQAALTLLLRLV